MYRCINCKKIHEKLEKLVCLNCGGRIFEKIRSPKIIRVRAR